MGQRVTVELKNDMEVEGRIESVDQFLNVKLSEINVIDEEKYPHLVIFFIFIYIFYLYFF